MVVILLQSGAFWIQEHKGHIPKVGNDEICQVAQENRGGLHGRYGSEEQNGKKSCYRSKRELRGIEEIQAEAQCIEVRIEHRNVHLV